MHTIPAKTLLTRQKSPAHWFGADWNMNLYRGCSHGCIYCDSRSECYGNDDFDHVYAKENALLLLRDELRRKQHTGIVSTGAMSDPYNPHERTEQLTRGALALFAEYGFGVTVITKSSLICRDIDVLRAVKRHAPVLCKLTVTTADDALARRLEPHAPLPSARLEALARLSEAGLPTCILLMPVLPWLTDSADSIRTLVRRAKEAGVHSIYPMWGLTLRDRQRAYFYQQMDRTFPGLKRRYIERYGTAYQCAVPDARKLERIFVQECKNNGILYKMQDIISDYQAEQGGQLSWF